MPQVGAMSKNETQFTPVAPYARVSSDRQDVDLSVAARPEPLEITPKRTVTSWPAST